MEKYEYKIKMLRTIEGVLNIKNELEELLNNEASKGWKVVSVIYHVSLLCHEIVLERKTT